MSNNGDSSNDEKLRKSLKPDPTNEQVIQAITSTYHQKATIIKELESYDDRNYLIELQLTSNDSSDDSSSSSKKTRYLCKVYNGVESQKYINCSSLDSSSQDVQDEQVKALSPIHLYSLIWNHLHLEQYSINTSLPLPIPSNTTESQSHVSIHSLPVTSKEHSPCPLALQLLEWVEGSTMASRPSIPIETLLDAGTYLAKVCTALDDLTATNSTAKITADRYHAWDGKNTLDLQEYVQYITKKDRRKMVQGVLDDFKRELVDSPTKPDFRMGILQGDFNDANIILNDAGNVSGVIDFGDTTLRYVHVLSIQTLHCPD